MTYYEPPTGSFGGTLGGGSYQYEPPNGVNCELGGCGNGGGQPCYETIRTIRLGLFSECPNNQANTPDYSGLPDVEIPDGSPEPEFDCTPVTKCPTPTEIVTSPAVLAAATSLMALSLAEKVEYGAFVYKNSDGTLRVGSPIKGDTNSVPAMSPPIPSDAVGSIHTHWKDDAGQGGPSGCAKWYNPNYT